ncbi:MAG: hypothetical protein DDT36_01276 [Firmicutes bacterium]|nr:hypothetical protein [Bacillota bacterium]
MQKFDTYATYETVPGLDNLYIEVTFGYDCTLSGRCHTTMAAFATRFAKRNPDFTLVASGRSSINSILVWSDNRHVGTVEQRVNSSPSSKMTLAGRISQATKRTSSADTALVWAEQHMQKPADSVTALHMIKELTPKAVTHVDNIHSWMTTVVAQHASDVLDAAISGIGIDALSGANRLREYHEKYNAVRFLREQSSVLFVVAVSPGSLWCREAPFRKIESTEKPSVKPFDLNMQFENVRAAYAMLSAMPADKVNVLPGMGLRLPSGFVIVI